MIRALAFLPIIVALVLGAFFYWGLSGDRDPARLPSALISKPVPAFDLPALAGTNSPGLSQADLQTTGRVTVVNVFASWCGPCRAEHPVLTRLAEDHGFNLVGINYKDKPEAAAKWLEELGNPYTRIGADETGRAAIEWGLTGVPESYIISGDGVILYREAGPVVGDGARRFLEALDDAMAGAS
jgi:cytochrome c biogenesis protein CcmG/thiol:disulfide interchange protein DsbE